MDTIAKELLELNEKVDELEKRNAKYEGVRDSLFDRLKKEFNCASLESAIELKEKKEKKLLIMEKKIKESIISLRGRYGI